LQGFVCHLHYLLHQAQNDSLHLRRTGPTVVDKHQIFINLNQKCHPRDLAFRAARCRSSSA
jgi:hypothetical protein